MSQQESLTNLEKAKRLRELRKSLDFTQERMADELGLDPTYLSQLENGRREVDAWWVTKSEQLVEKFGKERIVKVAEEAPAYVPTSVRERCHYYLNLVLDRFGQDPERLAWVYIELQRRFPLSNSGADAVGEEILNEQEAAVPGQLPKSSRSRGAGGPSARISGRGRAAGKGPTDKPSTPKSAPK